MAQLKLAGPMVGHLPTTTRGSQGRRCCQPLWTQPFWPKEDAHPGMGGSGNILVSSPYPHTPRLSSACHQDTLHPALLLLFALAAGGAPGGLHIPAQAATGIILHSSAPTPRRRPPWRVRKRSVTQTAASSCSLVSAWGSPAVPGPRGPGGCGIGGGRQLWNPASNKDLLPAGLDPQ